MTKHEAQSFVRHWNMMTLSWKCRTRAAPSCDIFNLGFIIFQCPLTAVHHLYNDEPKVESVTTRVQPKCDILTEVHVTNHWNAIFS